MATLGFGVCMPDLPDEYWPNIQVGETADFSYDATADITANGGVDPIVSASIATKPSGTGELAPQAISVTSTNGDWLVTVKLSGGVAGRDYIHQLILTTQGGDTLPILIGQVCSSVLAVPPVPPPPSPSFGTAVNWQ
jgi:hypothetical protein